MVTHCTRRYATPALIAIAIVGVISTSAAAQEPSASTPGHVAITGSIDFLNAYAFRGIRQDDTGLTMWPAVNVGLPVYSGDSGLKRITVNVGSWNSLQSGVAGSDGLSGERWYESDVHAALDVGLRGGVTIGTAYTVYTSPNGMFTTVKEVALKLAVDDRAAFGSGAVKPYALVAFELDTQPGTGQADGGFEAGKYLEIGAAPGYTMRGAGIAFPVKVGLSLGGYYELAGRDHRFGFFSASSILTVPLGSRTSAGRWEVRSGVEYQALGDTTKAFNGGDGSNVIGSIGLGWSRY